MNICQRKIRVVLFQTFQLGLEDIFAGRKPDHDLVRVVLDQLERNIALSGAGGMNNRDVYKRQQPFALMRFITP